MNLEQLHKKLLAAARANPPGEGVPYSFQKRIMARIAAAPAPDMSALWANALWRLAAPCVAVALLLGTVSFFGLEKNNPGTAPALSAPTASAVESDDLSQHLEKALLASVTESEEVFW